MKDAASFRRGARFCCVLLPGSEPVCVPQFSRGQPFVGHELRGAPLEGWGPRGCCGEGPGRQTLCPQGKGRRPILSPERKPGLTSCYYG